RETCGQRKEQRQYGIGKHQSEQNKPENGINHAQDNCVTWYGLEILPAQAQGVAQIGQAKLSNDSRAGITERVSFMLCDVLDILGGHGRISFSRRTVETTRTLSPRASAPSCLEIAAAPSAANQVQGEEALPDDTCRDHFVRLAREQTTWQLNRLRQSAL